VPRLRLAPIAALAALIALPFSSCGDSYEVPTGEGEWILVDLYHTRLQNPLDHRMVKGSYAYQGVHGYSRLFDHLDANGYPWGVIENQPLSAARLEGYKALFINLVSSRYEDFTDEEVEVIKDFVRGGGGLFLIADHTNVYRHAERCNRFLIPMGLEITYHSSLDTGANSVSGLGWIAIDNLEEHPTNSGVDMISFQTGGVVQPVADGAMATARTSERGYGDLWIESNGGGFYGDWRHTDDELEPKGNVPVVAAAEYGEGRVVVVGDQNIYGDAWLHFGDNFKHALNVFEWVTGNEDAELPLRNTPTAGTPLAVDIKANNYAPGDSGSKGYYTFFVNFNRDQTVTTTGVLRYTGDEDAIVFPTPENTFSEDDLAAIRGYLDAGKRVVITVHAPELVDDDKQAAVQLIRELAPGFTLSDGTDTVTFDAASTLAEIQAGIDTLDLTPVEGYMQLEADARFPGVEDLDVGMLSSRSVPELDDAGEPVLDEDGDPVSTTVYDPSHLAVTSDWGEPLLQASTGADVARIKKVGAGELIVFVQDRHWRNSSIGKSEAKAPPAAGKDNVEFQYLFVDYLETPVATEEGDAQ
jgi:hypothetical protein